MEKIESVNNKIIKYTNSLKDKKTRKKEGLFIAEGLRLVIDGMKIKKPEYVIISENFSCKDLGVKTYLVSENVFKKLSDTVTPQGILGVFKIEERDIDKIEKENTIVLNNISDPGNMGTILRTAYAAGFKNIVIDKKSVDLYNPKAVRSTMSALFNLNIYTSDDLICDLNKLKEKGFEIIASALTDDSQIIYRAEINSPALVVMGNEANGIDKEVLDICDKKVIIPMKNKMESLNVSSAASVIMYEILRRQEYEN